MRRIGALVTLACVLVSPRPARAWDPSTTHQTMLQRAVLDSAMHRRWMDQSGMQRGVFSPLRIDPARLSAEERRAITLALRRSHAASGAQALGGPGACPGPGAPPSTRKLCVEGDLWEASALGWMQLGMLVELVPRGRLLHHFTDLKTPQAPTWTDRGLPRSVLRTKHRRSGGTVAGRANRTLFEGESRSAAAWMEDEADPFAPPRMFEHLRASATAPDRAERDHHLAMALLALGATLHVVQDLSVPAHARGDVTAFFAPLSTIRGDRGLPLQEFARLTYGRIRLPGVVSLSPRADETGTEDGEAAPELLAPDLRAHLFGDGTFEGLVHFTGRRFFSETTVPSPMPLDPELDPERAAAILLEHAELAPEEKKGATLRPWPSETGYLVTRTGRPLAAFDTDEAGRIRLYLDRQVYRDQCAQLIPKGVQVSASILDLVFPAFPRHVYDRATNILELEIPADVRRPELLTFVEDRAGHRTLQQRITLRPATRNRIVDLVPPELPEASHVVLVVLAEGPTGSPLTTESALDLREEPSRSPTAISPVQRGADPTAPASEATPAGRRTVPPGAAPTTAPGTPPGSETSPELENPFPDESEDPEGTPSTDDEVDPPPAAEGSGRSRRAKDPAPTATPKAPGAAAPKHERAPERPEPGDTKAPSERTSGAPENSPTDEKSE